MSSGSYYTCCLPQYVRLELTLFKRIVYNYIHDFINITKDKTYGSLVSFNILVYIRFKIH
jgi:hypothetical protein